MPVSNLSVVERIARVIAGRIVSINAEGDDRSAGDRVDSIWRDYVEDARSVLRTLREPDETLHHILDNPPIRLPGTGAFLTAATTGMPDSISGVR